MRRWLVGLSGVALVALPCWALAQEALPSAPTEIERDLVTAQAEAARAATLDADRVAVRREVALAVALFIAPFDLTWGLEP